jgi:hypothetical protein
MCFLHIYRNIIAPVNENVLFAHMIDTFDALLAPIARLMVRRGIPFPEFAERMKGHYLGAAREQAEGKVTDSKLSLMTGLQRRDIARLKEFKEKPPRPHPLTRLVAVWRSSPDYSQAGNPRVLRRLGPKPSFESLAREIRQDIHPRTLLDSLKRAGTVTGEDNLTLTQQAYIPAAGSPEQLAYLSENTGDHLNAAYENTFSEPPEHFERALHVTGLSPAQVAQLRELFEEGQMALLSDLQKHAAQMKQTNSSKGQTRFRAGGYFYKTQKSDTT